MAKIGRPGLPEYERRRVWDLWKDGHSFSHISRRVGAPPGSVFSILKPRGGIYYPTPHPRPTSLTLTDREEISRGIAAGRSIRNIAEGLGRSPSTISREIRRNKGQKTYRAVDANDRAQRRRHRPQRLKLQKNPVLCNYVSARLSHCWSPEQITGRLHRDYPGNRRMHISPEAIYRSVYLNSGRKILPHNIHHNLRRHRPIRHGKHYTTRGQWRSTIKNAKPIADRPRAANDRTEAGHWEGDLILGPNTTQVATLVDRVTRVLDLVAAPSRAASCVKDQLINRFNGHHQDRAPMRTLTWDRGMELAEHEAVSQSTAVEVFFADPRSPWQRGTNENSNGLTRQYLPKKTDLGTYEQSDLDKIAHELNTRPRKCLGFRTPLEAQRDHATRKEQVLP
ncbi:Transposase and inactivated derivatives, IS30 family [Brevibacterium sp. 239c]|uniref:IS30 family transposase n=1 Tax=Brevibacterium sp. 239c TaxID=1965356 RepID=UPI000C38085D|nr:IS30 family transposase [Brevibacterium sp. 239c]SMY05204.1 Transposase and inactivated derivatives, IS30 family [Brevibacterium sp. 239c]